MQHTRQGTAPTGSGSALASRFRFVSKAVSELCVSFGLKFRQDCLVGQVEH